MKALGTFAASLVCLIGFPLLPLLLERLIAGSIGDATWTITAAIYCASIGMVSQTIVLFILGAFASTACGAMYGALVAVVRAGTMTDQITAAYHQFASYSFWLIVIFSTISFIERFRRHVLDEAPFFEFKI